VEEVSSRRLCHIHVKPSRQACIDNLATCCRCRYTKRRLCSLAAVRLVLKESDQSYLEHIYLPDERNSETLQETSTHWRYAISIDEASSRQGIQAVCCILLSCEEEYGQIGICIISVSLQIYLGILDSGKGICLHRPCA
jgi:hypothetical protein